VTYALAKQLVLTLPNALSPDAMADLNEVWAQLLAFGERIKGVPLSQIQTELNKFEQAIRAIVEREAGAASGGTDTGVDGGDPGSGSEPGSTAGPGSESTTGPGEGTESSSEPTADESDEPNGTTTTEPTAESTGAPATESLATP
jgi:putative peptide zinc metalloprotease protein